ncbi:hypothetical protein RhiLY_01260 [Ceratobasidium sp. AG-Ba]|nr:hypothetical protein RhiLY_01260 [Ceratobasidium sp. AG-Ba]
MIIAALIEAKIQADSNLYIENPVPELLTGCLVHMTDFAWVPYVFALTYESGVFGLTIWKTWKLRREFGAIELANRFMIDGTLYYVVVLAVLLFSCWGATNEVFKIATSASG